MLLTPHLKSLVAMRLGGVEPNLANFGRKGALKRWEVYISWTATPIFTKFGWYDVGPILRPYLEGGHDWSMWAWLITTNPNRHTFSLLHFQCTSHYGESAAQTLACVLIFAPSPSSFGPTLELRGGAWPLFITACCSSFTFIFSHRLPPEFLTNILFSTEKQYMSCCTMYNTNSMWIIVLSRKYYSLQALP